MHCLPVVDLICPRQALPLIISVMASCSPGMMRSGEGVTREPREFRLCNCELLPPARLALFAPGLENMVMVSSHVININVDVAHRSQVSVRCGSLRALFHSAGGRDSCFWWRRGRVDLPI